MKTFRLGKVLTVFGPSLLAIPPTLAVVFMLMPVLSTVGLWASPYFSLKIFEFLISAVVILMFASVFGYQLFSWISLRNDLSIEENTAILTIFAIYVSALFGVMQFFLYKSNSANYSVDGALQARINKLRDNDLERLIKLSEEDIWFLRDANQALESNCRPRAVITWNDHKAYALSGREAIPENSWTNDSMSPSADCNVWIIRHSHSLQGGLDLIQRRNIIPESDFQFFLQKESPLGLHPGYRFFIRRGNNEVELAYGTHELKSRGGAE